MSTGKLPRLVWLTAIVLFVLPVLGAAAEQTPQAAAKKFWTAIWDAKYDVMYQTMSATALGGKTQDEFEKQMGEQMSDQGYRSLLLATIHEKQETGSPQQRLMETMIPELMNVMSWEIGEESINGDHAKVKLFVKMPDFKAAGADAEQKAGEIAQHLKNKNFDDKQLRAEVAELVKLFPMVRKEGGITLVFEYGEWKVEGFDTPR